MDDRADGTSEECIVYPILLNDTREYDVLNVSQFHLALETNSVDVKASRREVIHAFEEVGSASHLCHQQRRRQTTLTLRSTGAVLGFVHDNIRYRGGDRSFVLCLFFLCLFNIVHTLPQSNFRLKILPQVFAFRLVPFSAVIESVKFSFHRTI